MNLLLKSASIIGNLDDKDINVSTQNCKGLSVVAGGTNTSQTVSSTISAVGQNLIRLEAKLADGTVLKSVSFDAPNPQVSRVTNLGFMVVELNPKAAPLSTDYFLQYVNSKFYENTIIHKIVTACIFVAQDGRLTSTPSVQAGQKSAITL